MQQIKHGGLKEEACVDDINLAYKLEDGMKIYIPSKQEKQEEKNTIAEDLTQKYITTSSGLSKEESDSQVTNSNKSAKVNINTATQTELETLPGIGASTAIKIIDYRKDKGKFKSIEDIKEVKGIGDSKFEKIKEYITVKQYHKIK